MKRNNCLLAALIMSMVFLLSGCRLALDDSGAATERFVGVNVLLLSEWLEDDAPRYEPHEPDGYLLAIIHDVGSEGEPIVGSDIDEHFADIHMNYKSFSSGDWSEIGRDPTSETYSITGTLYVDEGTLPEEPLLILESVYQRSDGTLYAVDDGGMSKYSGSPNGLTLSLSQDSQVSRGHQTISQSTSIEVSVKAVAPCLSAALIEMDGSNAELRRQTLGVETDVTVSADVSWALVEEYLADGTVRRTAINRQPADSFVTVYRPGDNGLCLPVTYTVYFASGDQ